VAVPTISKPRPIPAASLATALSVSRTFFMSSNISSSAVPKPASPSPKQAPCWTTCIIWYEFRYQVVSETVTEEKKNNDLK
jgi:hypothetical protein